MLSSHADRRSTLWEIQGKVRGTHQSPECCVMAAYPFFDMCTVWRFASLSIKLPELYYPVLAGAIKAERFASR